ncbi:hypothetical protein ERO13_D11G262550v2 [Gossypium hirsutum]|uniref:DUF4283 domain-containing protein n=4 Tax=Gossypium TaxID=3633 RepID=A0A5J5PGT5_GOSBA|nr:hypothetical protein ES319_D11G286500v1 [Gossypium barbadense]KAG4122363.1 hypothetical protein ERO13_D11G262550v2 [Gossypium hirsutum]TYG46995.1 hypothetical protein ES288_D11G302100v1 [Gossypium darwinii]TYH45987.1 hypothetical protein ES332_D11G304600v1 [Gossypium tomentosum]TYI57602.1 hypothetical protein E1A91_D11G293400v1 [Gossypium mustelinum]
MGSFLTASVIRFQAMRTTLANLWHPLGGMMIKDLGKKFLEGSPRTFNNHLLIFHRLKVGEDLLLVPLFWVDF